MIEPCKRGAGLKPLTVKARQFCLLLIGMVMWEPTEAAKQVGYKNPSDAANRLMKDPRIKAFLGKKMREREERCELKADDVLNFLQAGLYFSPLHLFQKNESGKWMIKNIEDIPEEIGRLIEKVKLRVVEKPDGSVESLFEVELISKSVLFLSAMKHLGIEGTQKIDLQGKMSIDWDGMHGRTIEVDSIEEQIEGVSK